MARPRRAALAGAALGAALALALPPPRPGPLRSAPAAGPLVDDAEGALARVELHLAPDAEALTAPALAAFLGTLDPGVAVDVLVPPPAGSVDAVERARAFLGRLPGGAALAARARIVTATGGISPWARDRALAARRPDGGVELLLPARPGGRGERRAADWRAPLELAAAAGGELSARVLALDFDAGDLVVPAGACWQRRSSWRRTPAAAWARRARSRPSSPASRARR